MKTFIILTSILILTKFSATAQTETQIDSNTVFTVVEKMPNYPGGYIKFSETLTDNFDFSKQTKLEKCFYILTIGRNGEVLEVKKLKGDTINEERIINALKMTSGKWTSPSQNGHKVIVRKAVTIEILKNKIDGKF